MLATTLFSVLLASCALAAPEKRSGSSCDVSKARMNLPTGQTALVQPTARPSYIAVAIGTQNYTCTSSGTYTNVGALAELFDVSCLYDTAAFPKIADAAYSVWKSAPPVLSPQSIISFLHFADTPAVLGQHYHIINPTTGSGVIAKWDFTSQGATAGNANAYVVAAKVGGLAAPTSPQDIDWVSLKNIQGKLASDVYRIDTRGGQPPASCTPGSQLITVKYSALYWFFGSSL